MQLDSSLVAALLNDLIRLVILAVGGYVVAYVRGHYSAQQIALAREIAADAVTFAEQVAKALNLDSAAKFQHALAYARQLAARAGLKFTDAQWQGLIEAAVHDLFTAVEPLQK